MVLGIKVKVTAATLAPPLSRRHPVNARRAFSAPKSSRFSVHTQLLPPMLPRFFGGQKMGGQVFPGNFLLPNISRPVLLTDFLLPQIRRHHLPLGFWLRQTGGQAFPIHWWLPKMSLPHLPRVFLLPQTGRHHWQTVFLLQKNGRYHAQVTYFKPDN